MILTDKEVFELRALADEAGNAGKILDDTKYPMICAELERISAGIHEVISAAKRRGGQ